MRSRAKSIAAVMAVLAVICAAFAAGASAAPAWKFEAKALEGKETILGGAYESGLTIPGMTTKCENFLYKLAIENVSGSGTGKLNELPLYNCTTSAGACTVKAITPEALPWASHLTTAATKNYVVFEGVKVTILYAGKTCVLNETVVRVTGSAGGWVNNENETATFSSETLKSTGTELRALGQPIEWTGLFPTEAFEWHREQPISVS